MFINFKFRIGSWISLLFPILIFGQVKETHQYIKEWIQTEQLISEEKNNWESEKATLLDLQDALSAEISELETKLEQFEKENVGAAKNRSDLSLRKEEAEETTKIFYKQIKEVEKEIKNIFPILPSPLRDQTRAFLDKINGNKSDNLPLRNRLDEAISILRNIHSFHRSVHFERQEFSLDDGKSREFSVLYFGLGVAYFVNESGTVAGWGKPSPQGWLWTRQDTIAKEVSTGVAMIQNRTLPRFLKLPVPTPSYTEK